MYGGNHKRVDYGQSVRKDVKRVSKDNYYYNAVVDYDSVVGGGSHIPIPFVYKATTSEVIVENPSEYYLSVVRFQLPGQLIPLFFNVGYNGGTTLPFANTTFRSVTLTLGASNQQRFLIYTPQDLTIPVPTPPIDQYNIQYYAMRSYQQYVDQINVALASAFAALPPPVLVPALVAPYMTYDPDTQLFSLFADQRFVAQGIHIFMNTDLYNSFLPSFDTVFNGSDQPFGKDYEILIKDNKNNSVTIGAINYYQMKQEFKSINNINQFRTIVLTVNNIPIRYETTPSTRQNNSVQTNSLNILTDFIPALTNTAGELQTQIVYYPTAEYRLIDVVGDSGVNELEIRAFWGDKYENLYPILVPAHDNGSVKLLFRNRKLYYQKPEEI